MPLYEYECKKCGHRFEKIQKFSDPPVKKCPECGGAVEQLLSPPAVQFKGSGWYVTDYAKKSSAPSSSNGESAAKKEEKKEGKKETAAKPETSSKSEKHK
jgi:putative FmdB family regulatory protein